MSAFLRAWRASAWLPTPVVRAAAGTLAWYAWATRAKPAVRLEENLARVTGRDGRDLRRLARRGMASVARYYAEVLEMRRLSPEAVDARVRLANFDTVASAFESAAADDRGLVGVLSHCGNWDMVGAYAGRHIVHVTAVAEVLKPEQVFEEFVALREKWGMRILGHQGSSTFRQLIGFTRSEYTLACLLSDRDISGSGVEVQMWGQGVKVAPGPAALAIAAKTDIVPVMIHYERLTGARRRAARSRWGIVLTFGPIIAHDSEPREGRVEALSQRWAGWFAEQIADHPEDWHMMQRFGWTA